MGSLQGDYLASMADLVRLYFADGRATISLARPAVRNAISLEMIVALRGAIEEVSERAAKSPGDARLLVLEGEGACFCAGMDLKAVAHDPVAMGGMLRELSHALLELRRLSIPTIASVQGAAIGGGCGLVIVCDLAVTHPEAKLGYPEVDLGICPAVVAPWLVRKIGAGPARAMLLMGGTMSGAEAFARGLTTRCVARERLNATVDEIAAGVIGGGPTAFACTKRFLNDLDGSLDERVAAEAAELSARVMAGSEAQARIAQHLAASEGHKDPRHASR